MNLTRNQIMIIFGGALFIIVVVLIFTGVLPGRKQSTGGGISGIGSQEQTAVNFWGIENDNAIKPIIEEYAKINKGIKINYIQFDEKNYEKNLVNALASGQGPDILMFHNTWLPKHGGKIFPLASANFSLTQVRQLFPQIVEQDFIKNNAIYALPIYIDTLAFLYNKDIFDSKGVAIVPRTWNEFRYIVPRLRELDFGNRISKAAAAIGGSEKSVDKATDLLNLIMFQAGTQMIGQDGKSNFSRTGGVQALNFYLQFSDPNSSVYTWNDNLRYSIDGFSQKEIAAIFNYQSAIPVIKSKSPFLNLAVAPMLQYDSSQSFNYADYWGLAVSNQSRNVNYAWDFILYFSTNSQIAEKYLQESNRPPALRILIQKYLNDTDLGVFSQQALTAKSWAQPDSAAVRKIFSDMIESVLSGRLSANRALEQAEEEVNSL